MEGLWHCIIVPSKTNGECRYAFMEIILSYKIQKTVSIDLKDFTLTKIEIENKIDALFVAHAPEGFDILDSDYYCFDREPLPIGCEPLPPNDCWIDIDGFGKLATNGWAIVTSECPPINSDNIWNAWQSGEKTKKALEEFLTDNALSDKQHQGYFHKRFLPLAEIPGIKIYGKGDLDPGFCYVDDRLIAIIMPTHIREQDSANKSLFQFASVDR